MLYRVHLVWAGFELTRLVVTGTDYTLTNSNTQLLIYEKFALTIPFHILGSLIYRIYVLKFWLIIKYQISFIAFYQTYFCINNADKFV